MKRSQPDRNWDDVTIEREDRCLVCGRRGRTERAHLSGRKYDQPKPDSNSKRLWVNPLDVEGLCGPALEPTSCHYKYDNGLIDILQLLPTDKQARMVEVLGSIESARVKTAPSDYTPEIHHARVQSRIKAAA